MNAAEAMKVVEDLTFVLQRMRSISNETLDIGDPAVTQHVLEDLQPWVHGPKSLLIACEKVLDRGTITPQELYNLCTVAHRLQPEIAVHGIAAERPIPEPDVAWLTGQWAFNQ